MAMTRANQEKYVSQGLALGLVAAGHDVVPADKVRFDLAFTGAWRAFEHRHSFSLIANQRSADPYYQLTSGTERRRGPMLALWRRGDAGMEPYLAMEGWSVAEAGELFSEWTGVPWSAWQSLALDFASRLGIDADDR